MAASSQHFTCAICFTHIAPNHSPPSLIENHEICIACIRSLFAVSITSEASFPPRWGGTILDPENYRHVLDPIFLARFRARRIEWECPAGERVYCACEEFLGRREDEGVEACGSCRRETCLRCATTLNSGPHECDPGVEAEVRARAFQGLKQGKDWQECPGTGCGRRVELMDGCNHVRCHCGVQFCFVCGRGATARSRHWGGFDGCPRYGQPVESSRNTAIDEDDEHDTPVAAAAVDRVFRWNLGPHSDETHRAHVAPIQQPFRTVMERANRHNFERAVRMPRGRQGLYNNGLYDDIGWDDERQSERNRMFRRVRRHHGHREEQNSQIIRLRNRSRARTPPPTHHTGMFTDRSTQGGAARHLQRVRRGGASTGSSESDSFESNISTSPERRRSGRNTQSGARPHRFGANLLMGAAVGFGLGSLLS